MFITVNGQLGSGKSEICRFYKEQHGFEVFSTGAIQREWAKQQGISTLEQNKKSLSDYSLDHYIDTSTVNYARDNPEVDTIFDSRLAWHFVPRSFKIHLLVSPVVAAKRVYNNRKAEEEKYVDERDAMLQLISRRAVEHERYLAVYGVDMYDFRNYDLILDTTSLGISEVCSFLYERSSRGYGDGKTRIYLSPANMLPTRKIGEADLKKAEAFADEIRAGRALPPIGIIRVQDTVFIRDGHARALGANLAGAKLVEAVLSDGDASPEAVGITFADVADWEKANGTRDTYVPPFLEERK